VQRCHALMSRCALAISAAPMMAPKRALPSIAGIRAVRPTPVTAVAMTVLVVGSAMGRPYFWVFWQAVCQLHERQAVDALDGFAQENRAETLADAMEAQGDGAELAAEHAAFAVQAATEQLAEEDARPVVALAFVAVEYALDQLG